MYIPAYCDAGVNGSTNRPWSPSWRSSQASGQASSTATNPLISHDRITSSCLRLAHAVPLAVVNLPSHSGARFASQREPSTKLWPKSMLVHVGLLLVLALVLAGVLGVGVWFALGRPDVIAPPRPLTARERLDSVKVILAVIAGIGGIVALTVAYRKQRYSEDTADRERTRLFIDRLVKAVEQLGHDRSSVRVAGVYAMASLADEWPDGRQMCIDVLCAYLRMPYDAKGKNVAEGEREVRRTLFRVIRNHLRPEEHWSRVKWSAYRFSFEGAVLDRGDLSGAQLAEGGHMTFHGVRFVGRFDFSRIRLNGSPMWFTKATFAGEYVKFDDANFSASNVRFDEAEFADGATSFRGVVDDAASVSFERVRHAGGTVDWGPFPRLSGPRQ